MENDNSILSSGMTYSKVRHRFAIFLAVWAFIIVSMGATVKSHEAGLSIPEGFIVHWIPDWWNRPNLKYEFFHRFLVPVLGFGTLGTMIWTLWVEKRSAVRKLSVAVFGLVILQGVIGYLTVDKLAHPPTSIPHAVLGQSILSLLAVMATMLSPEWTSDRAAVPESNKRSLRSLAKANLIAVFVQLLLGAALRHDDHAKDLINGREWVFYSHLVAHILGALAVLHFLARLILHVFREHREHVEFMKPAKQLMMLTGLQLMLGTAAAILKIIYVGEIGSAYSADFPPPIRAWTATAHVAVGAVIFVLSALVTVRSYRYVAPVLSESSKDSSATVAKKLTGVAV